MSERDYKLEVMIVSTTPSKDGTGKVQQRHVLEEYSDDVNEHTEKNFVVDDAVTNAVRAALITLAEKSGYETGKGKGKSK